MLLLPLLALLQSPAQTTAAPPLLQVGDRDASSMATTYFPIESWIYPAIERLAAAGYIQTAFSGLRPWTHMAHTRHVVASPEFLRSGTLTDFSLTAGFAVRRDWELRASAQQERWSFPASSTTAMHNLTATFQISYQPTARKL